MAFTTDDWKYGGWGQINHGSYPAAVDENGASTISLYLPARTAVVLQEGQIRKMIATNKCRRTSAAKVGGKKSRPDRKPAEQTARRLLRMG